MTALDVQQTPRYLMDADEQARADFLASLPINFLECRADGHVLVTTRGYGVQVVEWRGRGKRKKRVKVTYINWAWREQSCDNCGYVVETQFNQTMRRLGARPNYEGCRGENEDGEEMEAAYLLRGHGRISPAEARRELWRRQAGEQPPAGEIVEDIEEED
jgi:hypothetical protein